MTLLKDPSTSTGTSLPSGAGSRSEQLTELGAALRRALDGHLAEERARARETMPAENLLRDPGQSVEQAREWVLNRLLELSARGFGAAGVKQSAEDQA
ncbi:MAG: hypothetical protein KJ041_10535, partial [Gammaproteobacteria bacterium]|nr:hypothetical protein [Gammaproteobacteria bacterium]